MNEEVAGIHDWYEAKGFRVDLREEQGLFVADLCNFSNGQVIAKNYGSGDSLEAAASRAQERFIQEE